MNLQPHQQRVVDEKAELDIKVQALSAFIVSNPTYKKLTDVDKQLLTCQVDVMREYSLILHARVMLFNLETQ